MGYDMSHAMWPKTGRQDMQPLHRKLVQTALLDNAKGSAGSPILCLIQ